VPQHQAVVLTYPERVTPHNLEKLKARVLNGACTSVGGHMRVLVLVR
jgi:hypothetical protein